MSKPGGDPSSGISSVDVLIPTERHPACRQRVVSPLKLANKVGNGLPTTYIVCADPIYKPLEASRNWFKAAGWKTIEIQCGHDAMVIAPERLADLLDADAA